VTLCTHSIAAAIAHCSASGGGHVVVPSGTFLTGAITLLSNVDLHLEDDATLKFSTDPDMYPLVYTRWGGSNVTTAHRSYTHSVRKTLD
jgi:polygalacturonase